MTKPKDNIEFTNHFLPWIARLRKAIFITVGQTDEDGRYSQQPEGSLLKSHRLWKTRSSAPGSTALQAHPGQALLYRPAAGFSAAVGATGEREAVPANCSSASPPRGCPVLCYATNNAAVTRSEFRQPRDHYVLVHTELYQDVLKNHEINGCGPYGTVFAGWEENRLGHVRLVS